MPNLRDFLDPPDEVARLRSGLKRERGRKDVLLMVCFEVVIWIGCLLFVPGWWFVSEIFYVTGGVGPTRGPMEDSSFAHIALTVAVAPLAAWTLLHCIALTRWALRRVKQQRRPAA
jgi:hypothetical protein